MRSSEEVYVKPQLFGCKFLNSLNAIKEKYKTYRSSASCCKAPFYDLYAKDSNAANDTRNHAGAAASD